MYQNILVPVDGSPASTGGLIEAIKIAKEQGSKLRLFHVVNTPILDYGYNSGSSRSDVIASLCDNGKGILNGAEITVRQAGLPAECVMFESVVGSAASAILDQARQWPASLIVMGSHARGGPTRVGSDTAEVLLGSSVPVLLVRGGARSDAENQPLDHVSSV